MRLRRCLDKKTTKTGGANCSQSVEFSYHKYDYDVINRIVIRAVYWQESGNTIRVTIQGQRYDIL